MPDNIFIVDINEQRSSLIRKLEYNEDLKLLTVYFRKYYTDNLSYADVSPNHFEEFSKQKSIGKYYLHYINKNFKQVKVNQMSEQQKMPTKNEASNKMRFIDISINVKEIIKEWIHAGKKGDYLNLTLCMKPDGEMDDFGNLGFVTQKVPTSVYKEAEAKEKGSGKLIRGPILGNACEVDWSQSRGGGASEIQPGGDTGNLISSEAMNDLPF